MPTPVAICYTSTQPITLPSPVLQDKVFFLSELDPPQTVQLYARGINLADGGDTPASYAWSVVDAPQGSTATFSDASAASPTFGPVTSLWGNYRLKCVVTMASGLVSESRLLYAPNSSFVHIRVKSDALGLQKPAKWERDWQDNARAAIGAVETVRASVPAQTISDHSDVAVATGPALDILCGGGLAESGGLPLHLHHGADIDLAGAAAAGVLKTEIAPADAYSPVAINCERLPLTATVPGTLSAGQVLAAFYLPDGVEISSVAVAVEESGVADAIASTTFQLRGGSVADYEADTLTDIGTAFGGAPAAANGRKLYSLTSIGSSLPAGAMLLLYCEQAVDGTPPRGTTLTVTTLRKV